MSFSQAVRTCFKKYATFNGVASRPEYWWFFLFNSIVSTLLNFTGVYALRGLWTLIVLVPGLAVAVRRLHDSGRSAWWLLSVFLPAIALGVIAGVSGSVGLLAIFVIVIFIWSIVLFAAPSKFENNPYRLDASVPTVTEASLQSGSSAACPTCGKLRLPGQNYCTGCGHAFNDAS